MPMGEFQLSFSNINYKNTSYSMTTSLISINSNTNNMLHQLNSLNILGTISIDISTLQKCLDGCIQENWEEGYGYKYTITFLTSPTINPIMTVKTLIPKIGFPDEIIYKVAVVRKGYYEVTTLTSTSTKSSVTSSHPPTTRGGEQELETNLYLTPFFVMIFNNTIQPPPTNLTQAIKSAMWVYRYISMSDVKLITLPKAFAATYIVIQREGFGVLSIAEIEVYSELLHTLSRAPLHNGPIPPSDVTEPYQPIYPFKTAFSNSVYDGRWNIKISQDLNSQGQFLEGFSMAAGKVSDVVLVITDYAGYVHTYYQDITAIVSTLPKYGRLYDTVRLEDKYGKLLSPRTWNDAFQLQVDTSQIIERSLTGSRKLGVCYGVDTSGKNGIKSGNNGYRYCIKNYGVPPMIGDHYKGDVATPLFLQAERVVAYTPYFGYTGPDYFTYEIYDGLNKQSHITDQGVQITSNEVTMNIRDCRVVDYKKQFNITESLHPLCSCAEIEGSSLMGVNVTLCDTVRSNICSTSTYKERPFFISMCTACEYSTYIHEYLLNKDDNIGSKRGNCLAQTMRAVYLITQAGLCSTTPRLDCSTESFTEPGKESKNFLSLNSPIATGFFSALGNSFGGEGRFNSAPLT